MLGRKIEVRLVKESTTPPPGKSGASDANTPTDIPIPAQVTYIIDHAAEKLIMGIAIVIGLNTLSKILINKLS